MSINRVGFVGWRGMVGSVLLERMVAEGDFDGLEPEFFPIHHDSNGRPRGRLMLTEPGGAGVLEVVDALARSDDRIEPRISRPPGSSKTRSMRTPLPSTMTPF